MYVRDPGQVKKVKSLLEKTPGIGRVLDAAGKKEFAIDHPRESTLSIERTGGLRSAILGIGKLIAPETPLTIAAGESQMTAAFITSQRSAFRDGELEISLHFSDGVDFNEIRPYRLLGPSR